MTEKARPRMFYDVAVYMLLLAGGMVLIALGVQLITPAGGSAPAGSGPMPIGVVTGLGLIVFGAALIIPGMVGLAICLVRALRRKKGA
ncbi:MAG: hypothetical protein HY234_13045 [Acidobacteria bacterium]|nr:hypothetical protein [Acidobacteriota bacterium]